jgi:hypothetical protein
LKGLVHPKNLFNTVPNIVLNDGHIVGTVQINFWGTLNGLFESKEIIFRHNNRWVSNDAAPLSGDCSNEFSGNLEKTVKKKIAHTSETTGWFGRA